VMLAFSETTFNSHTSREVSGELELCVH
jgi:hypothetical protein